MRISVALAVLALLADAAIAFLVSRGMNQAALTQVEAARQAQQCITAQLQGVPAELPPEERSRFCEGQFIPPVQTAGSLTRPSPPSWKG